MSSLHARVRQSIVGWSNDNDDVRHGCELQMSREMLRFGCRETGDGRRESEVGVSECGALLSGNHSLAA